MLSKTSFFRAVGLSILIGSYGPPAAAMGDPLENLRLFFVDLFRVQIDGPETINRGFGFGPASRPPVDGDDRRALHPIESSGTRLEAVSCENLELLDIEDWHAALERAREAHRQRTGNTITPEMRYPPNYWQWSSPVYVSLGVDRTFFGSLRGVSVSVAVLGQDFDVSDVLDQANNRIEQSALDALFEIRGYTYEGLFRAQIDGRDVRLVSSQQCPDYLVYQLEIPTAWTIWRRQWLPFFD